MASCKRGSREYADNVSHKILKRLLIKTLNNTQLILLNKIAGNRQSTLSSLLRDISKENKIPLSTLKLNSKKLNGLEIIDYNYYKKVELTDSGLLVLGVLKEVIL